MVLKSGEIKRLGIFCAYDKDGIIDDYIIYMLKAIRNAMTKVLVVCNGMLVSSGKDRLKEVADEILIRENTGLDAYAYRYGLQHEGWGELSKYDEVVMFNDTIMGPVNSFDDMFDDMNKCDLDFWGITKHYKIDYDPFGTCEYGYIPEHIQTYFMVIRNKLLISADFRDYWDKFSGINSYEEAIGKYEVVFTKKFSDLGYNWGVYVKTDDIEYMNKYPLMYMPIELVKNRKCPVFKRRMFFANHADILENSCGNISSDFIKYLSESGKYDVNMIWDNILRVYNQADIVRCLNLMYILSSKYCNLIYAKEIIKKRKIALIIHICFEELVDDMCRHASYMPPDADIYIIINSVKKKEEIEALFKENLLNEHIEVRVTQERRHDVSGLLIGVEDCIFNYDYVCFVHDKRFAQVSPGTVGSGFANKCLENVLRSSEFVNNVICLLEENERIGILSPSLPNHAGYFSLLGNEWAHNYESTKNLAKKLQLTVSIDENKPPIAPYGTMFWFRPAALKRLYNCDWKYEDFSIEQDQNDNSILHAIKQLYPFVVQQEGYYPAILMSDYYASIECTNMDYYTRTMNNAISDIVGRGYYHEIIGRLKEAQQGLREVSIILEERNNAMVQKHVLELKALETMKYVEKLQAELSVAKGEKHELELKSLETMKEMDSLIQENNKVKGEKHELELKSLETMKEMDSLIQENNKVKGEKHELELKSLETMKEMDSLIQENNKVKGEKYELELKSLETMKKIESMMQENAKAKGEKYELELKLLEAMKLIEELQGQIGIKYKLQNIFKKRI